MLPMYDTKTFNQIFPEVDDFLEMIENDFAGYCSNAITEDSQNTLYWLLFARYGNTHITNATVNQFKAKLVGIIYTKGPSWERNLKLQKDIRSLTEEELRAGAIQIYNTATNPETAPSTTSTGELTYVNAQNVTKHKRSKLDAYQYLQDMLRMDVTESFIKAFDVLFSKIARPSITRIYVNEEEAEEEEN